MIKFEKYDHRIIELTLYNLGFYNRILTLFRKNHIQKEIKQSIKGRHRYPTVIRRRLRSASFFPFVLRRCFRHARLPRPRPRFFFYAPIVAVGAPNHRRVNHHRHQQQRISFQEKQFFWSAIEYCVRKTEALRNWFLARILFLAGGVWVFFLWFRHHICSVSAGRYSSFFSCFFYSSDFGALRVSGARVWIWSRVSV